MRLTLLKLTWLLAGLIAGGCMSPLTADEKEPGGDVVVDPQPVEKSQPSIAVSASPDAFAEMAAWFGKSNTITIKDVAVIERDAVSVNVPAGATVSYSFSETAGVFQFAKPLPTVKASVLGFKFSPTLSQVTLTPDGAGVASTGLGRYRFQWLAKDEDSGAAASDNDLPEVWAYSMAGCVPCVRAKLELAAAKDLPFKIVWKEEAAPTWLQSRPAFWWHVSGDTPRQDDVNNTRQTTGWNGVKDFVERWKHSRTPKKFTRSFQSGQASSVARPDRDVGSRSVAIWSINGDFTPRRSVLLSHLSQDGIHRGRHDANWLATLTTEQLRWLHDRDHQGGW